MGADALTVIRIQVHPECKAVQNSTEAPIYRGFPGWSRASDPVLHREL